MAISNQAQQRTFQLGRLNAPVQIVWGAHERDANKLTSSVKLLVTDEASLEAIREYERRVAEEKPGLTLNSCIYDEIKDPNSEQTGYIVRAKMTKRPESYVVVDPWVSGAALTLDGLNYGHTVCMLCNAVQWEYKGSCGVTIYANTIKGIGRVEVPWGRDPVKQAVAKNSAMVWE